MTLKITQLMASDNIANLLSKEDLENIGSTVVDEFEIDVRSRSDWDKKMKSALELALQVMEDKSFPWPNASNVKFPLLTIAALQYHARAYPVLIDGTNLVKCRIFGDDEDGKQTQRARRVEQHMSYQILEEDENWEDQMDKVLITQPIIGCAFKKTYHDSIKGHNISESVFAKDLVVSYYTKSLETAPRISHVIYLTKNDIYERVQKGLYSDIKLHEEPTPIQNPLKQSQDDAQGISQPQKDSARPFEIIEQHRYLDLDKDGYEEPYVVVVHKDSKKVLRIVARYFPSSVKEDEDGTILSITPEHYFTKYSFIPSPDGGFYDLGFGVLLGPLNESINTLINQLIDAGTMSNTGGGFLSKGIKIRGGTQAFQPNEWKSVESTGDDLRKGIYPLPIREPSNVLFTLLSLLINYGERIGGSVDILVGQNPGQNTPAETSRTMAEQGMKIFTGIFKRTYRGLKEEFRKLYRLNQLYLTDKFKLGTIEIVPEDYESSTKTIVPAADPNMVSDSQKMLQAQQLLTIANPAMGYNMYQVHKKILSAWKITDVESILPDPAGPNAIQHEKPYQVQLEEIKAEVAIQKEKIKAATEDKWIQLEAQSKMAELQMEVQLNQAKIDQLMADALLKLEMADSEQSKIEIAAINAQIGAAKTHQEQLLKTIDTIHKVAIAKKKETTE